MTAEPTLFDFLMEGAHDRWGSIREREIHRRIRLTVAAYAYEFCHEPTMTDAEFDQLALDVDLSVDTGRPDLDAWFRENFVAYSGVWIQDHPELAKVKALYERIAAYRARCAGTNEG